MKTRKMRNIRWTGVLLLSLSLALAACGGEAPETDISANAPDETASESIGNGSGNGGIPTVTKSTEKHPASDEAWCADEPCPCDPDSIRTFSQSDKLYRCKLSTETEIQGIPVAAGQVQFNQEGQLRFFETARQTTIQGFPVATDNVRLDDQGNLISFDAPTPLRISDIVCQTRNIRLHPNGTLDTCVGGQSMGATYQARGYSCRNNVYLWPDGSFRGCVTAEPITVAGLDIPALTNFILNRDGGLYRLDILGPGAVRASSVACAGREIYFHPNGQVGRCPLADDTALEENAFEKGEVVCFDADRNLVECMSLKWTRTL